MVYTQQKRGVIAPNIIILIGLGIIILGGVTAGIINNITPQDAGTECPGGVCSVATSTAPFPEPDWAPRTQCGDGVCNPNEKANPNACPQDCAVVVEVPPPTIDSFTAIPATVVSGQDTTLSWSSTSTFCAAAGDEASWFVTGGAPKGSVATKPLYIPRTFILSCMAEDGESIIKSVTVDVTAPPLTPTPTITLRASPESIGKGETATITWSTTNATTCTASGGGTSSGWSGTRLKSGSFTTPTLTTRQTYVLVCTGNGRSASRSVTVAVAEGPQVTFTATPSKTTSGEKVTLAWLAPKATFCTASGDGADWGWTGELPASDVQTTAPLKESKSFAITCKNSVGGSTVKNAQVIVTTPKLSLFLTPATQSITYGKVASLKWTSAGTTSCTGSGLWADDGTFGLSDTKFTKPLTESAILEVTCTGEGGTITQKATVNVTDAIKCSLAGGDVPHGTSVTAYKSANVKYNETCISEIRTCTNGSFPGSYMNASCTVLAAESCPSTTLGTIQNGASVTAYQSASVKYGETCASETRTCTDGALSGNYAYTSCTVADAKSCSSSTLGTVSNGASVAAYKSTSVKYNETCASETRTCTDGILSSPSGFYYINASCTVADAKSCPSATLGTIQNGASVTAYKSENVKYNETCASETRTCTDGALSGNYAYKSCTITPAKSCTSATLGTIQNGASVIASKSDSANINECVSEIRTCTNGALSGDYAYKSCTERPAKWTTTNSVHCVDTASIEKWEYWEGAPKTTVCDTGEHSYKDLPTESCTSVSTGRKCWLAGPGKGMCDPAKTETTCYATIVEQYPTEGSTEGSTGDSTGDSLWTNLINSSLYYFSP